MPSRPNETVTVVPSAPSEDPPQKVDVADAPPDAPDQRYATERLLGEGGMGTVLLVRDRIVGRHVALKQLKAAEGPSAEARARFNREARLQGQLEHPAIVPVYDVGVSPDGSPFFTMKRVRGESLSDLVERAASGQDVRFSRRKLLSAFSQLCVAVHYAHERGVVHRDIKPSNIMLGPYGEIYLLDWGVAKIADEADARARRPSDDAIEAPDGAHTGQGIVMGTLSTMAPEQALGASVDARTDVYALGVVLFELLTLRPLHPKGSFDEVVAAVVKGIDTRAAFRAAEADVAPELEALCVAATRLHPADRVASAIAIHDAIEAYLDGDRDQELRRESAKRHASRARVAADRDDEAGRVTALGEVGKALALDPSNRDALGTLVELLTTPPKITPREVIDEEEHELKRQIRLGGFAAAIAYGYVSLNGFSTWQLGVKDVTTFVVAHVLWGCAFLAGLATIWKRSYVTLFAAFLFGMITCVYITKVYGPFLVVAPLLGMHAVLYSLVRYRPLRVTMLSLACVGWTISVFGDRWGLFPDTMRFVDGDVVIHSHVIGLPAAWTTLYLYVSVLGMLIAPALLVSVLRNAYTRNEHAMRLQAWQLRKLVSDETELSRSPAAARPASR
ncbi:MAG: serine/threonine protein kinase [Labilithrix sp.]|nr:serine/threonine protein kinase [Labilithrix sp.]